MESHQKIGGQYYERQKISRQKFQKGTYIGTGSVIPVVMAESRM
jgi:hypothetical protein